MFVNPSNTCETALLHMCPTKSPHTHCCSAAMVAPCLLYQQCVTSDAEMIFHRDMSINKPAGGVDATSLFKF